MAPKANPDYAGITQAARKIAMQNRHNPPQDGPQSWGRGDWLQTYTGKQFFPMDPDPAEVNITDIAHALSLLCRYNGHVQRFYSVAEHCVLVSHLVSPEEALWGLLHDATEAYVGDMVRPLKNHMPDYQRVENRVMLAIAERFDLSGTMPDGVKTADTRLLLDERDALLGPAPAEWDVDGVPYGVTIEGWSPERAETEYLARFKELTS